MNAYRRLMTHTIIEAFNKAVEVLPEAYTQDNEPHEVKQDKDGYLVLNGKRLFRIESELTDESLKNYYGSLILRRQHPVKALLTLKEDIENDIYLDSITAVA